MDHYETLGLNKDASQEEIKKAYKDKSKQYHPDSDNDIDVDLKEEMIRKINSAKILLDPEKRKRYDAGEDEGSNVDHVLNAVVQMVMAQLDESNFDNVAIWENMIDENNSKIAKTESMLVSIFKMGRMVKKLTHKKTIVGKMATLEYSKIASSIKIAHEQWNLDRRIRRFLKKDCDCLDELFGSEDPIDSPNNYYDVVWKQLQ